MEHSEDDEIEVTAGEGSEASSSVFEAGASDVGLRLDVFVTGRQPALSRSAIQRRIRLGSIRLNGGVAKPGIALRLGDRVEVDHIVERVESQHLVGQEIALSVLYEDESLIVLNKPRGLVVHPGAGVPDGTLVNALVYRFGELSGVAGVERPGIVHRLDKDTSGCLVVARNDIVHRGLAEQFAGREVHKVYVAIVDGRMARGRRKIEEPIGRHPVRRDRMTVIDTPKGREALTLAEAVGWGEGYSVVCCQLHTGRTHQIRVHLRSLGHSVLGDPLYAGRNAMAAPRLMLHAAKLGFRHPVTGRSLRFEAPIPEEMMTYVVGAGVTAARISGWPGPPIQCEGGKR